MCYIFERAGGKEGDGRGCDKKRKGFKTERQKGQI